MGEIGCERINARYNWSAWGVVLRLVDIWKVIEKLNVWIVYGEELLFVFC